MARTRGKAVYCLSQQHLKQQLPSPPPWQLVGPTHEQPQTPPPQLGHTFVAGGGVGATGEGEGEGEGGGGGGDGDGGCGWPSNLLQPSAKAGGGSTRAAAGGKAYSRPAGPASEPPLRPVGT